MLDGLYVEYINRSLYEVLYIHSNSKTEQLLDSSKLSVADECKCDYNLLCNGMYNM